MNSKNLIIIILAAVSLGLLGVIVVLKMPHEAHDDHLQVHADEPADDTHAEHAETQSPDEHAMVVELSPEQIDEIGLRTAVATGGIIEQFLDLSGQIDVNQDRMVHIVPRVEGVVTEVYKNLGDTVTTGEVIAVIDSRDLADAKAAYLAAAERYEMAGQTHRREQTLWKEKIISEQEYLDARQALTEAGINLRTAEQKLAAIGFDDAYLNQLADESQQRLTRFEIKAPFDGTVIEKHIVLGELVTTNEPVFIIADLSTVWVQLQVYPKDLPFVRPGQAVTVIAGTEIPPADGSVSYVGPMVRTDSRTALARVVLNNDTGVYRPGLFVTGSVTVAAMEADVVVPASAVQMLEGRKCVFVRDEHGFEPVFVQVGRQNPHQFQILSGLQPGREYVAEGAFALKSQIITSTLGSHAGHGH